MDTFDFYNYAARHGKVFDTIVIDPPSFARNKKKTFSVQKNYDDLINGALSILSKWLVIIMYKIQVLSLKAFKNVIKTTLNEAGVTYEIEEVMGLPKDFKHIRTINPQIFKSCIH